MAGMTATRATKTRDELLSLVPRGAWDSHMHIFNGPDEDGRRLSDPAESSSRSDPSGTTATANSQPVSSHAPHQPPPRPTYQPPPSTIRSAIHLLGPIVPKMVIVQPSVLGEDNRVTLGGVRDLKRWGQSGSARLGEGGAESGIVSGSDDEKGLGEEAGTGDTMGTNAEITARGDGVAVVEVALGVGDEVLRELNGRGARGVR